MSQTEEGKAIGLHGEASIEGVGHLGTVQYVGDAAGDDGVEVGRRRLVAHVQPLRHQRHGVAPGSAGLRGGEDAAVAPAKRERRTGGGGGGCGGVEGRFGGDATEIVGRRTPLSSFSSVVPALPTPAPAPLLLLLAPGSIITTGEAPFVASEKLPLAPNEPGSSEAAVWIGGGR